MDFLGTTREIPDPIERTGEDAVINTAALALAQFRDEHVFQLLLGLLERRLLSGVVQAVGVFRRPEATPYLIDALAEDDCRPAAETALRKLGRVSEPALVECARRRVPFPDYESVSSTRRRRSALRLLAGLGVSQEQWPLLRSLIEDEDREVAVLACRIGLECAPASDQDWAARRVIQLLAEADWVLADTIEGCLAAHFKVAEDAIGTAIRVGERAAPNSADARVRDRLVRVQRHAASAR